MSTGTIAYLVAASLREVRFGHVYGVVASGRMG